MKVITTRFGQVDVPDDAAVRFPEGIRGFNSLKQYVMLRTTDLGLFRWLQSAEVPALAFVVCDPRLIVHDYEIHIRAEELLEIGAVAGVETEVLVILTHPHDRRQMTADLRNPILINRAKGLARQIVLDDGVYADRHRVFADEPVAHVGTGRHRDVPAGSQDVA